MDFLRKTWLLWAGLGLIAVGYVALAGGRLSFGPLLLVAGYCVVLPVFLWRAFRSSVGE